MHHPLTSWCCVFFRVSRKKARVYRLRVCLFSGFPKESKASVLSCVWYCQPHLPKIAPPRVCLVCAVKCVRSGCVYFKLYVFWVVKYVCDSSPWGPTRTTKASVLDSQYPQRRHVELTWCSLFPRRDNQAPAPTFSSSKSPCVSQNPFSKPTPEAVKWLCYKR